MNFDNVRAVDTFALFYLQLYKSVTITCNIDYFIEKQKKDSLHIYTKFVYLIKNCENQQQLLQNGYTVLRNVKKSATFTQNLSIYLIYKSQQQ